MENPFVCSKDNIEERKNLIKNWENKAFKTGIKGLDEAFGGNLYTGSLWLICAGTGVGKTTALLATAKKMVREGKKVAYITIEMSYIQILKFCQDSLDGLYIYEMESMADWKEFEKECEKIKFDAVFYDYLGAQGDLGEWDKMIDFSAGLAKIAIQYDIPVFTACQATIELTDEARRNPNSSNLFGLNYIAYSKGMANKVAGGIYIVNDGSNLFAYNFKCRYNIKPTDRYELKLNFKTKEWSDVGEDNTRMASEYQEKFRQQIHSASIL